MRRAVLVLLLGAAAAPLPAQRREVLASWRAALPGRIVIAGANAVEMAREARDLGADALLLERRPQVDGHPVEHVLDPLLEVDAEDEMNAALEVQAQVDRLAGLPPPTAG